METIIEKQTQQFTPSELVETYLSESFEKTFFNFLGKDRYAIGFYETDKESRIDLIINTINTCVLPKGYLLLKVKHYECHPKGSEVSLFNEESCYTEVRLLDLQYCELPLYIKVRSRDEYGAVEEIFQVDRTDSAHALMKITYRPDGDVEYNEGITFVRAGDAFEYLTNAFPIAFETTGEEFEQRICLNGNKFSDRAKIEPFSMDSILRK